MSLNSEKVEPKKTLLTSSSPTNTKKGRAAKGRRRERNKTKSVEDTKEDDEDKTYDSLKSINAFSQVSRYHTETIDSYAKDIDLKDLNILVGDREILTDANLKLNQGVHYGLIGQNGIGKSTLLKAIGYKLIIGFPEQVQTHYVEQLENVNLEMSVIDTILESDKKAERIKKEHKLLQEAVEGGNTQSIVKTVLQIKYDRLCSALEDQEKVFKRRSRERAKEARAKYFVIEEQVKEAEKNLTKKYSHDEEQQLVLEGTEMLNDLYIELDLIDADALYAKASKILSGLGFSEEWQKGPMKNLSGGWRIRASLAQALFLEPFILLLDEPTNHLDFPAIIWLEGYLKSLTETTLVIVSHDRAFLNEVVDEIIVLKNKTLKYYSGNYDIYEQAYEEDQLHKQRQKETIEKKKQALQQNIQKNLQMARKSGDDKRLQQVASRKKKLVERTGLETNQYGFKFKLNRDMVGYFDSNRIDVELDTANAKPHWDIPEPGVLRNKDSILKVQNLSYKYGNNLPWILRDISLNIELGNKVGIMGSNGEGKSTFVSLISGRFNPVDGTILHHPQAKIGCFEQHDVEKLVNTYKNLNCIQYLSQLYPEAQSQDLYNLMGSFGISGSLGQNPIYTLSGGQVVRLIMASIFYNKPHFIILDEPTNHLDTETIEVMIENLKKFSGSVIIVSHDQYFVDQIAERVYYLRKQRFHKLEGGVKEYIKIVKKDIKM
ncbi:P-loop containing nucleoside triphosphate hydrolase protein [Piromyces finnis]|uniref:p-loop containing nucleoside triphosphate hydrolase protein n=1 Tax=Piromyces finnis TaxID=1754191 RepID=A0A1Y1UBT9_9FUNG|nr:P-loop containing nucleoside triphosphate hydrolase protein [Piromyces finnis]ORX42038.1 P-loop containing nucleoside triphosphate hydrolase protein [Piromyces finnis]|eukprot:ORX35510.1 P-loop containing nucleoside triphosphate hydrolase protein [Piromyces finnis]